MLPLVVFLKVGLDGIGIREVIDRFGSEPVMTLRYRYVGLPALPAADYLRGDNWLGVALSALMKSPKQLKVPFGIEAIQRLSDSPLSDGKKSLLGDCIETYIDIPDEDSKRFQDILELNATGRVPVMHKTRVQIAHEEGIEKGIEKGIEEGHHRGMRAAVTELLEARFGTVPPEFVEWLGTVSDQSSLRRLLVAASQAASFDEFRLVSCS